jgi:iron(III) transport system permease protein
MFARFRPEVLLFQVTAVLLTLLVAAPLVTLILGSLSGNSHEAFTTDLGLGNFERVLTQSRYLTALWNTLRIAVASTVIATVVGVALAWLVARTDMPGRWLVHLGVVAPFFVSPFIGALAWGLLLSPKIGILNQFLGLFGIAPFDIYTVGGIIWVMGIYYAPYVYMFVQSALYNLDPTLEEAAFMSGLSPWRTVFKVSLPLVSPAIMSGMLLTFVAAAGQFGVPSLLGTPSRINVMTTYIYDLTNTTPSRFNLASAMSVILLLIACLALYAQHRVMRGRSYVTVGGKSTRPKTLKLGAARVPATVFSYLFLLLASVLPLLMLAYVSFVPYYSGHISFSNLTLHHYISLIRDNQIAQRAFVNTIVVSVGSACAAAALGVIISWIQLRTKAWYRGAVSMALVLPVAVPAIVLGLAIMWTWIYAPIHVYGTTWLLFIGYLTGYLPFAVRSITAVHQQIDKSLEEAVSMVGGGWLTTLRHVTLPLLKPGIAAGWTLLFIVFVRELAISILLYAPGGEVLSVLIYNRWAEGDYNALAAMAMVQVLLMTVVIVLIGRVFKIDLSRSAG